LSHSVSPYILRLYFLRQQVGRVDIFYFHFTMQKPSLNSQQWFSDPLKEILA
jgi:hypothetical protein